jgi:hypothetical protein
MTLPIKLYCSEIRQICSQAKKEHRYEELLTRIKGNVNEMKLNVIKYKDTYVLSEFDLASEQIEDDLISIDLALQTVESAASKDDLLEWQNKLTLMQNRLRKLFEIKKYIELGNSFKNEYLKLCMNDEYKKFDEYEKIYLNLIKECKEGK